MAASAVTTTEGSGSGCTSINVSKFTYDWVIKRFKLLLKENGECIESPLFRTIKTELEWKLSLYPEGFLKQDAGYVSIYLHPYYLSEKSKTIKRKARVEISLPRFGKTHTLVHQCEDSIGNGYTRIMLRSELLDLCGPNDTFTVCCKIESPSEIITNTVNRAQCIEQLSDSQSRQLIQDFRLLLKESKLSDVDLIVGTQTFPAHKIVLAARSPVFSAMFEHKETRENLENQVKIENMDPDVVEAMLEFFYTAEVNNIDGLAYGLLEAAEKYDLPGLRTMCENAIYKALNKDNAAEILVLADRHNSYKLKERVMNFMDDHLSEVVQAESYAKIDDPELLKQFILSVADRRK